MSLKDLISTYSSRKELCSAIGCSRQFLSQLENGKRPFPVRLAMKVERLTNGKFTVASLCPELDIAPLSASSSSAPAAQISSDVRSGYESGVGV
jgi:DNA-binding transcriptional regulator YdaS (Cro superfamily)